ncbi:uncharacterized protein LOC116619601 [Nematostella vectensis]|uniref:uncharacterized protein LOC116619601 n=1 Tax=Nematostella vectensis TaxID=45351 RepID=UPI0020776F37|nr:uncharacterized protein LOC116619601 [Nematostella vectensis]
MNRSAQRATMEGNEVITDILSEKEIKVILKLRDLCEGLDAVDAVREASCGEGSRWISVTRNEIEILYKVIAAFRRICPHKGEYDLENEADEWEDENSYSVSATFEESYIESVSPGRFIVEISESEREIISNVSNKIERERIHRDANDDEDVEQGRFVMTSMLSRIRGYLLEKRKTGWISGTNMDPTTLTLLSHTPRDVTQPVRLLKKTRTDDKSGPSNVTLLSQSRHEDNESVPSSVTLLNQSRNECGEIEPSNVTLLNQSRNEGGEIDPSNVTLLNQTLDEGNERHPSDVTLLNRSRGDDNESDPSNVTLLNHSRDEGGESDPSNVRLLDKSPLDNNNENKKGRPLLGNDAARSSDFMKARETLEPQTSCITGNSFDSLDSLDSVTHFSIEVNSTKGNGVTQGCVSQSGVTQSKFAQGSVTQASDTLSRTNNNEYNLKSAIDSGSVSLLPHSDLMADVHTDRDSLHRRNGTIPRERFRRAIKAVMNENRKKRHEVEFWKSRGDASYTEIVMILLAVAFFGVDLASDIKVTADHFIAGDYAYGVLTILLLLVSAVIVNVMSVLCYKDDEEEVNGRRPESGWCVVMVTHSLLLGLLERYWRILVKAYRIKTRQLYSVMHFQEHISMNLDVTFLYVIMAFTEDAPQLTLQLYILFRRYIQRTVPETSLRDIWTAVSIFLSFISYSRVVVDYVKCLRDSKKRRGRLHWHMYCMMWLWRSLLFTSRVLVLVFFAAKFPYWLFLFLSLHSALVLAFISKHKLGLFPRQPWKQRFTRLVIALIHTFCIFFVEAERLWYWATVYYTLEFVEAIVLTALWFTQPTTLVSVGFEVTAVLTIALCYALGLVIMVVYYKCLHPDLARVSSSKKTHYFYRKKRDRQRNMEAGNPEVKERKRKRSEVWGFD